MGIQRFVKVNPTKNERRWYVISWGPTLFDTWAVVRTWGRLGGDWSQCQIEEFATEDEAVTKVETQAQRRMRRGYAPSEAEFRRKELTRSMEETEVKVNA